jgi:hypothetical protein
MKRARVFGLTALISSLILVNALSAEETEVRREVFSRQVSGRVSGISKNFIAVEYAADSRGAREIALSMDKDTKGVNRNLKEIGVGDRVSVIYDEITETKKGETPKVRKRLAKSVEFRKAAEPMPQEPDSVLEKSEGAQDSGE